MSNERHTSQQLYAGFSSPGMLGALSLRPNEQVPTCRTSRSATFDEVLELMADGLSKRRDRHVLAIFAKLGVASRAQAMVKASELSR